MRAAGLALTPWLTAALIAAALIAAGLGAPGCAREPAEALCPELAAGDLVVTEIRGTQTSKDLDGPWVELYNASGRALDLIGIRLAFRDGEGTPTRTALVRRSLPVEPGGYTVLGLFADTSVPAHVDYGFLEVAWADDDKVIWTDSGALSVESCDDAIDRVGPYALPRMGTFSLGGVPDANRNDLPAAWCTDVTQVGTSFPGTPRNPNKGCP